MSTERKSLEIIRQIAEMVVERYLKLPESITERGNREGGYLTIKNFETGKIEAIYLIGNVPDDKVVRSIEYSQEKVNRLYRMICVEKKDHITSYESRNPDNNEYGGAAYYRHITSQKYILSLSGLPELGDEACILTIQALAAAKSKTMVTAIASSMMHSVYFKVVGRPGQEQFRALLKAFNIKI